MADESNRSIEVTAPTQILVEGKYDKIFFKAFIRHALGKEKCSNIQVHSYDGTRKFKKFLKSFQAVSKFVGIQSVGIVRDADESEASAFQSLRDSLKSMDFNWEIPDEMNVPAQGTPSVTALILPGDGRPGALETLLCDTLTDELTVCVDEYFKCAERCIKETGSHNTAKRAKARARVYLAAHKPPDTDFRDSFYKKYDYWNLEHPALGIVREFLEVVSGASGFPLARE